jgi:hypothetical protein
MLGASSGVARPGNGDRVLVVFLHSVIFSMIRKTVPAPHKYQRRPVVINSGPSFFLRLPGPIAIELPSQKEI